MYRISYAVTIDGDAHPEEIDKLMVNNNSSKIVDMNLYKLLKSQKRWRYLIADLEKNDDREEMLLGR